jgi:hypothetical protein
MECQYEDGDFQTDSGCEYQRMAVFESGNDQKAQDHAEEPCIIRPNPAPRRTLFRRGRGHVPLLSAHASSLGKSTGYMEMIPSISEGSAVGKWKYPELWQNQ